jgi:hypothetical protein
MSLRTVYLFLLLAFCSGQAASPGTSMTPVPRAGLCVTEGEIAETSGNTLSAAASEEVASKVVVSKLRAFVTGPTLQEVEARFKWEIVAQTLS